MNPLPIILCLCLAVGLSAQDPKDIDPRALAVCDRVSDIIGDLHSCSFTTQVVTDVERNHVNSTVDGHGLITHHRTSDVYFSGHNRLMVDTRGDKGHRTTWYNGETLTLYSYDENNYITVDAPDSTVNMMYTIYDRYGIEFPAADFFNPYFTDDLIETMSSIQIIGRTQLDGNAVYHIVARNDEMNVEFWIADNAVMLPVKMRITYLAMEGAPRYEVAFSKWKLNPDIPMALYDFVPPAFARRISVAVKTSE